MFEFSWHVLDPPGQSVDIVTAPRLLKISDENARELHPTQHMLKIRKLKVLHNIGLSHKAKNERNHHFSNTRPQHPSSIPDAENQSNGLPKSPKRRPVNRMEIVPLCEPQTTSQVAEQGQGHMNKMVCTVGLEQHPTEQVYEMAGSPSGWSRNHEVCLGSENPPSYIELESGPVPTRRPYQPASSAHGLDQRKQAPLDSNGKSVVQVSPFPQNAPPSLGVADAPGIRLPIATSLPPNAYRNSPENGQINSLSRSGSLDRDRGRRRQDTKYGRKASRSVENTSGTRAAMHDEPDSTLNPEGQILDAMAQPTSGRSADHITRSGSTRVREHRDNSFIATPSPFGTLPSPHVNRSNNSRSKIEDEVLEKQDRPPMSRQQTGEAGRVSFQSSRPGGPRKSLRHAFGQIGRFAHWVDSR